MMYKLRLILLLLLFSVASANLKSQSIIIQDDSGNETTELLESVQTLTFNSDNLTVNFYSESSSSFDLTTISKIYFNDVADIEIPEDPDEPGVTAITTTSEDADGLLLYPNPATDILNVQNLQNQSLLVSIYRIDGTQVLTRELYSDDSSIDISTLQTGFYLLKADNKAYRFIKK